MRLNSCLALSVFVSLFVTSFAVGDTPNEREFIQKYKAAFEAKDTIALESFLYTKEAHPVALDFYKMMQSREAGHKISSIELVNLTPEDMKRASELLDGPGGEKMRLPLKPIKKLIIKVEIKDGDNSSTSTSENFIAEKDGKLVIPVPAPVK